MAYHIHFVSIIHTVLVNKKYKTITNKLAIIFFHIQKCVCWVKNKTKAHPDKNMLCLCSFLFFLFICFLPHWFIVYCISSKEIYGILNCEKAPSFRRHATQLTIVSLLKLYQSATNCKINDWTCSYNKRCTQ